MSTYVGRTPDDFEGGTLRLVDGPNSTSGRVEVCCFGRIPTEKLTTELLSMEVCYFGCWGIACDKGWDRDDANVACRQLGFETEHVIPTRGGYFGGVSPNRPIHPSQSECVRNEDKLVSCSSSGFNHRLYIPLLNPGEGNILSMIQQ